MKKSLLGMLSAVLVCGLSCGVAHAGNATAVALNDAGDIVANMTWLSTTPPKGDHFKTAGEASDYVLQGLKDKGYQKVRLVEDGEMTAYISVAIGLRKDGIHEMEVRHGDTQAEADRAVIQWLNKGGATGNQQIILRGFTYGMKPTKASSGM